MQDYLQTPADDRAGYIEDLVNALGSVIWEYDWSAEVYTFVSQGAEDLLGYPAEAWLSPMFWTNHVHTQDLSWVRGVTESMTEVLEEHEVTYRMLHRDGSVVWVRDIVKPRRLPNGGVVLRGMLVNVTAQVVAEQAARHAETGFREMIEAGDRLAMKVDMVGRFTYVSSALCTLTGLSESELLGTPFTRLLVGEERRRLLIAHHEQMSGHDAARSYPFHIKNAKGETRLLRMETATLFDRNGRPCGSTAMGEDVTDSKAMERELERRAEEFDTVIRLLGDTYVRVDTRGILRDFKGASADAFLVGSDEVLGKHAAAVFPADRAEEMRLGAIEAMETGQAAAVEYRIESAIGLRDFEARLLALAQDETAMVIREITDRNSRERKLADSLDFLERLLGLIDSGVVVINSADFTILSANTPAEWIFGYGRDELVGMSGLNLYPGAQGAPELIGMMAERIEAVGRFHDELELRRRDGSIFEAEVSVRPVDLEGARMLAVVRDITERRRNEENERQYQERLSAMSVDLIGAEDRERRHLAEELHDRVGQALAVARMHLAAALDRGSDAVDEEARECLPLLDEAIRETRAITTELSPPVLYELGLGPALHWLAERFRKQHGLTVVVAVDEGVSVGDEGCAFFFRAARELLVNVVKHAETRNAWVSLDRAGAGLVLTVADDGVGFDTGAPQSEHEDRGFGLFSVGERARYLGGSFELESEQGAGTRVTATIPI